MTLDRVLSLYSWLCNNGFLSSVKNAKWKICKIANSAYLEKYVLKLKHQKYVFTVVRKTEHI